MTTETLDLDEKKPAKNNPMNDRAGRYAIVGATIAIPTTWAISAATGFSFDNVIGAVVILGGLALLYLVNRDDKTDNIG